MEPWSIDAQESIQDLDALSEESVQKTVEIRRFLENDKRHFVVATKGFGKSLVLLTKRKEVTQRGFRLVPHDLLLDTPRVDVGVLPHDAKDLLYDEASFVVLWSVALVVAAVRASYRGETQNPLSIGDIQEPLSRLLTADSCRTVTGALNATLYLPRKDFVRLRQQYGTVLTPLAQAMPREVAIFIDNVDECFDKTPFWYAAQAALIEASYTLVRLNPKIRVFASVRREAWRKYLPQTLMSQQYEGSSVQLEYDKSEMRDIFERNIRADHDWVLAEPTALRSDAIQALVGSKTIQHAFTDETEDVFDYIYRHTLRRPRDLMQIGRAISSVPVPDRQLDQPDGVKRFRDAVNDAGTRICESYLREVEPHLDISQADFDRLCSMIPANVLTAQDVKSVCMSFNGGKTTCN